MKIFSWNIRGLNGISKHRILRNRLKQENMDLVMLQETKCDRKSMESIARKIWKPCEFICSEAEGASRGLAFLWNPSKIKVELRSQSKRIITISYKIIGSMEQGTIMQVYGPQSLGEKRDFMRELSAVGTSMEEKQWIVGGDFNMITSLEDKKGGIGCLSSEDQSFKELIDQLRLIDIIPSEGQVYLEQQKRREASYSRKTRQIHGLRNLLPT
jgi:exonuclease III